MDASQVIIRPVVSEKTFVLAEAGKYTFRVHDRAHKTQIRQAIEQLFDVKVVEVRTASVKSKPKRRGQTRVARGTGRRRSSRSALATRSRSSAAWREVSNADPQAQADVSRAPVRHLSRLRGDHPRSAGEVADRGPEEVRRAQLERPQDLAPPRRRRQAPVPQDRLQAPQGRRAGEGRARSSTTRTARPTSRCCTTPTARSATSSRRTGCASG